MYNIHSWPGLCLGPCWEYLQCSPESIVAYRNLQYLASKYEAPDILPLESLLPRSFHTTLNTYKARITSGISDVCHTTLNRQSHPTQLTVQDLSMMWYMWYDMGQPGRGCRLPPPGQLMIRDELLGYHNNNNARNDASSPPTPNCG